MSGAVVAVGIATAVMGMALLLIEPSDSNRSRYWLAYVGLAVVIAGLAVQAYFGAV